MIADALLDGHVLLADWLFVIAAVLFVLVVLLARSARTAGGITTHDLLALGGACVAVGLLVL